MAAGTQDGAQVDDSPYVYVQDWSVTADLSTGTLSAQATVYPVKDTYTVDSVTLIVTARSNGNVLLTHQVDSDGPAGAPLTCTYSVTIPNLQAQAVLGSVVGRVTIPPSTNQQFYTFNQTFQIGG